MFGTYTQFGLSSKYSYNKNCSIAYFINLISYRANFAVHGPTSFYLYGMFPRSYPYVRIGQDILQLLSLLIVIQ